MSKFLHLIEEFDPNNNGNPKWKLIDFLKSKGIKVSLIRNTDMVYIDTGEDTIAVTVSNTEEDSQESDLVSDVASDSRSKFQKPAADVVNTRERIAPLAINKAKKQLSEVEKSVRKPIIPAVR